MRSGFTLVELLVVISIIVVLAGLATPAAMSALGRVERLKGINNAKQIKSGLDLFASDFDAEYPSDETGEEIMEDASDTVTSSKKGGGLDRRNLDGGRQMGSKRSNRGSAGSNSKPSNYYYTQLMGRGLDNEDIFYHKAFKKSFILKKPDKNKVVDQGECVWGYTKNLQQTSSGHLPLVFDSPISGGDSPKFSKKVWDGGKVIMARLDGSTVAETIGGSDKLSGNVRGKVDGERVNLFAPESLEEGILVPADLKRIGSGN